MAEVKWIKITTDIFDDEKIMLIESLPGSYAIITVWFKLLCLAGKQNNGGVFMMGQIAYTEKMLATIFRMKEATVSTALKTFEKFGMVEIIDGVITIPNWGKHQNLEGIESAKEKNRKRVAAYRERQRVIVDSNVTEHYGNVTEHYGNVTVTHIDKDIDKDKDKDIDKEKDKDKEIYISGDEQPPEQPTKTPFDLFWEVYPKKKGKQAAAKAFNKVKVPVDVLIKAVEAQKRSKDWMKDGGQFIPHPTTWLNQGRWEDEVEVDVAPEEKKEPEEKQEDDGFGGII